MEGDYGVNIDTLSISDLRHLFENPIFAGDEMFAPMAADAVIAVGEMVCANASGYAVPADDAENYTFLGVALDSKDNTGGNNGDLLIRLRRKGVFFLAATSISQADVGQTMYVADKDTFDESATHYVVCGRLVKYSSATAGWLSIDEAVYAPASPSSGDALTLSDAGNHFAAADNTIAEQVQALAKTMVPLTIPRYTGWTKDETDKQLVGPKVELPFPAKIVRAYANLGTAPGSEKTLVIKFGSDTLITIAGTDTQGEDESLDIAVAANADLLSAAGGVLLNETAGGSGANLDLMLILARDDGE